MRRTSRLLVAAVVAALAVGAAGALTGCVPGDPTVTPAPTSSPSAPVFASDEEALAAAEEAYRAYLAAYDGFAQRGWKDFSVIEPFLEGSALQGERATANEFFEAGYVQSGATTFDSVSLQSLRDDGSGKAVVNTYLCVDVSSADIVDVSGDSVVAEDRPDRLPLEVEFSATEEGLLISRSDLWTGDDFC